MKNTGKDYEKFVEKLCQELQKIPLVDYENIEIQHNKKITDNNGLIRQFDIYWNYKYL